MPRRSARRGSAMLEFVLTGIPMIFIWISVVQMALGMWHYHTLQYAAKAAGAFIAHRGADWVAAGNTAPRIQDAATVFAAAAIGMPTSSISITFTPATGSPTTCTLNNCLTNATTFPPTGTTNAIGAEFTIKANYVFNSAISMYIPGNGGPVKFSSANLPAYTRQVILY